MGKLKGIAAPQHSEEEKIRLSKQVCDLYESQNCTLESACNEVGIPMRTFHLWNAQIAEIAEYYKKAKENADEFYWNELLRPKLKTSLQVLVEGFQDVQEVEEDVVWQGVMAKDSDGNALRKNKVTRSHVAPNPTSVIFGMKVVFPEKTRDRTDVTTNGKEIGQSPFSTLPIEKQEEILLMLQNASNTSDK